jgi:hypothetical protein
VAQFCPTKPHRSEPGTASNSPCQVPKWHSRIRPNRPIAVFSYLGLLQPHNPKPPNHNCRIRPNLGSAEYLLGVMSISTRRKWDGIFSIIWLLVVGLYMVSVPGRSGYSLSFIYITTLAFGLWWGIALMLAISGLRSGQLIGVLVSVVTLLLTMTIVVALLHENWFLLKIILTPNNALQPTATAPSVLTGT